MFRAEVDAARADRLTGDVVVSLPIAWQLVGLLLLGSIVTSVVFLSLASYSRVEKATGSIVPADGVIQVMTGRAGMIDSMPVRDGQLVARGERLASIRADVYGPAGTSFDDQLRAAIERQDKSLAAQSRASTDAGLARNAELQAQRVGLSEEIAQVQTQITIQNKLVISARTELDRARVIAERGFISRQDILQREEALAQREKTLSELRQSLSTKRAALTRAERSMVQFDAEAVAQASSIEAVRAEVAQQATNAAGAQGFELRAPRAGRITAITARVGQPTSPQTSLMTIIPLNSILRAELGIPTSAIGFVKKGQTVNLAIDTFPFQRFGTVKAKVLTVATNAIYRQGGTEERAELIYPVTVELERQYIHAFGRNEPLVPGMTLTARIVTEKQSLLQWLFEPLYAVKGQ